MVDKTHLSTERCAGCPGDCYRFACPVLAEEKRRARVTKAVRWQATTRGVTAVAIGAAIVCGLLFVMALVARVWDTL